MPRRNIIIKTQCPHLVSNLPIPSTPQVRRNRHQTLAHTHQARERKMYLSKLNLRIDDTPPTSTCTSPSIFHSQYTTPTHTLGASQCKPKSTLTARRDPQNLRLREDDIDPPNLFGLPLGEGHDDTPVFKWYASATLTPIPSSTHRGRYSDMAHLVKMERRADRFYLGMTIVESMRKKVYNLSTFVR